MKDDDRDLIACGTQRNTKRNHENILSMAARAFRGHGGDSSGIGTVMMKVESKTTPSPAVSSLSRSQFAIGCFQSSFRNLAAKNTLPLRAIPVDLADAH